MVSHGFSSTVKENIKASWNRSLEEYFEALRSSSSLEYTNAKEPILDPKQSKALTGIPGF